MGPMIHLIDFTMAEQKRHAQAVRSELERALAKIRPATEREASIVVSIEEAIELVMELEFCRPVVRENVA